METNCGVSVNLSNLPSSTTPLHIVLWKGVDTATPTVTSTNPVTSIGGPASTPIQPLNLETNETIKRLLERITVLEGMVSGLLETQKSSLWFSPGLRPTPTGIEVVSRRESMDAESDIGTVLSQLVRPTDARTVTISAATAGEVQVAPTEGEASTEVDAEEAEGEEAEVEEAEGEASTEVDAEEAEGEEAEGEEAEGEEAEVEEAEVEEAEGEEAEGEEAEGEEVEGEEVEGEEVEEAEAEAEEEIEEYKEIQWKGKTFYINSKLEVYDTDSDGELIETPIGVWREETQKLLRYKIAP